MNVQKDLASPRPMRTVAAATTAAVIALTVLWSVVTLFQSRGAPLQQLAAAERACADKVYASERTACMEKWIADARRTSIAER